MKHLSFLYDDAISYKKAIKESQHKKYNSVLIQVFTSILDKKYILNILKKLNKDFKNAKIVGTTTAGEISHAKMYQDTTVISVSLFEDTVVKVAYTDEINYKSSLKIAKEISSEDTKATIILSEGLNGKDYEGFLKGFREIKPDMLIAGGMAGDNFKLKQTYIFKEKEIFDKGAIAISFSSKTLYADNRYNLNWFAVGKEFTITKAQENYLIEIDGQKAKDVFEKYLGENIFKEDLSSLADIQLLYKEGHTVVSRTPLMLEDDKIRLAAPLKEGQKVRFGFSNASSVISGALNISNIISDKPAQAVYIFSCIARKVLLGELLENEFKAFEHLAPTSGFFTYGEFYSTDNNNALLNCTTTVLVLSEANKPSKQTNKTLSYRLKEDESLTFKVLTNFIEQTSRELDSNINLLQEYKEIVDKALLVSKLDKNGVITYVNDVFCEVSGYKKEELLDKNYDEIHNISFDDIKDTIAKQNIYKEILHVTNDKYISTTIMPIINFELKIDGYISIGKDITKEILSKKELEEKEKIIKAILDNQDSIVLYLSSDFETLTINQKFFEYFDFKDLDDFISKHRCICELFLEEDGYLSASKDPQWIKELLENPQKDYKVKIKTKDNKIRTFSIKIKKINENFIVNFHDITTLEEALMKAYYSQKAKSLFLANMSHEIRTPLNGILGFVDMLLEEELSDKAKEYVSIIKSSSTSLLNIVNDILDFSKIESGEMRLSLDDVDFVEEIRLSSQTFQSIAINKNIDYTCKIDKNIPHFLRCDIQRIKQVVSNLLSNAIKFTPKGGKVDFWIDLKSKTQDKVVLEFNVKDNGIGISKEKQEVIFKPFLQADNSISKKFGGTGLGLSITNQFLEMMGSKINLYTKEGEGSHFYFTLELEISKEVNLLDETSNQIKLKVKQRKGKILIAEDNQTNALLISLLLQKRGLTCKVVQNGKEALNEALKNDYDIILMDINMPIMDGLSAIKKLKEKSYSKPIVTLSANVIKSDIEKYKKAGASYSLHKPIDEEELENVLDMFLNNKQSITFEKFKSHFELLDDESIYRLLESLSSSSKELLQELKTNDLTYKTAHTIKGLAGNFGFEELAKIAKEAEEACKNNNTKKIKSLHVKIVNKLQDLKEDVEKILTKG